MTEYPKIQSVFKRDMKTHKVLIGAYTLPEFSYLSQNTWEWREKIDGTNCRIMWDGERITFGGRTDNAQMPTFLLARLQDIFLTSVMMELFKTTFDCSVCLYSEGYGARIQKDGGNYIKDGVDIALFDIRIGDWWLKQVDVECIASKLGLKTVPLVGYGTLEELVTKVQTGFDSAYGAFPAEGIVARPTVDLLCRNRQRVITKLKTKDF